MDKILLSPPRYRVLMQKFRGFHGPLEESLFSLEGWAQAAHAPALRQKALWLDEDIRAMGGDPAEVPICPRLPAVSTLAEAYGCAYVLEGSTLGGRHILHLPRAEGLPTRFFTGYGPATGERWKAFCASLEGAAADPDATVRAAEETFARLEEWLRPEASE